MRFRIFVSQSIYVTRLFNIPSIYSPRQSQQSWRWHITQLTNDNKSSSNTTTIHQCPSRGACWLGFLLHLSMATPPSTYTGRVQQGAEDYDGSIIIIIIVGKVLHNALLLPVVVADCCLLWTIKRSSSSGIRKH